MRALLILAAVAFTAWAVTACETVKGVGKDITHTGEWVQDRLP